MEGFTYNKETDIVSFKCCVCNSLVEFDLSDFLSDWSDPSETNQFEYRNLFIDCENCNSMHGFNMNIPEYENDELDLEEDYELSFDAINTRKYMRDIMWNKREDLMKLDREKAHEEHVYPSHITKLIRRNNIIQVLLERLTLILDIPENKIRMIKYIAMEIVEGKVSLLQAISDIANFLKDESKQEEAEEVEPEIIEEG